MIWSFSASMVATWHIPLILAKVFDIHLFKISDASVSALVLKKLPKRSSIIESDMQRGLIYGWKYVGYVTRSDDNWTEIYILTNTPFYKFITSTTKEIQAKEKEDEFGDRSIEEEKIIRIYERAGQYRSFYYNSRKLNVKKFSPYSNQKEPIELIMKTLKEKDSCVVFIYGEPGNGKSILSLLVAKELNASYCDSFNPTDPGDEFSLLYNNVLPTEEEPMVVVLEECDKIITKIHYGVTPHKDLPISVKDKSSWNLFMDKFDRGLYPYSVIILTSNEKPEFINNLDPSYIRPKRIDFMYHLEKIPDEEQKK